MKSLLSKLLRIAILFAFGQTQAQVILTPLSTDPLRRQQIESANPVKESEGRISSLLDIPFFDDFSNYIGSPDPSRWQKTGGTYVNNRYGQTPVSVGVVTFDGLQSNGDAYLFGNVVNQPCDSLISLPFRLSSFGPEDSVYLTLFWQPEGNGEAPNASEGDSIYLLFKTNSDTWVPKWGVTGRRTQAFQHAAVLVDDVSFFCCHIISI